MVVSTLLHNAVYSSLKLILVCEAFKLTNYDLLPDFEGNFTSCNS